MKKLLDEATDDLTRALLEAGVAHRPPAGNRRKVMLALAAGSVLGLSSSKAVAWLGTGAGKMTLAGVTLAVAGSIYASTPPAQSPPAAPRPATRLETTRPPPASQTEIEGPSDAASEHVTSPERRAAPTYAVRQPERNQLSRRARAKPKAGAAEVATDSHALIGLDYEVRLVDQLRTAVAVGDRALAVQLIGRHALLFPDGQLALEVSTLARRMERETSP